jgi:hypothetical protein
MASKEAMGEAPEPELQFSSKQLPRSTWQDPRLQDVANTSVKFARHRSVDCDFYGKMHLFISSAAALLRQRTGEAICLCNQS